MTSLVESVRGPGLRGWNISNRKATPLGDADWVALRGYGANLVRANVTTKWDGKAFPLVAADWAYLDGLLAAGATHGFVLVITLTVDPWGEASTHWGQSEQ